MIWHAKVQVTCKRCFLVIKKIRTKIWSAPNNAKIQYNVIQYNVVNTGYEKDFYKVSKVYIDPRNVVFKLNLLIDNPNIFSVI